MSLLEILEKKGKVLDFSNSDCDHTVFFAASNSAGVLVPIDGALIEEVLEENKEHLDEILLVKTKRADQDNYLVLFQNPQAWYKASFSKCISAFLRGDMFTGEQWLIEETLDGNICYSREDGELRLLEKCKKGWI